MLLPASGNKELEKPSNALTIPGTKSSAQETPGGMDNYKRYQQLVQANGGSSNTNTAYKRS